MTAVVFWELTKSISRIHYIVTL